jgi:uncharacterized protein (TIGR03089 family)
MTTPISRPDGHLGALAAQRARDGGQRPFVTFYDDATGERTELGWATFDNWVAKTANLLSEELEVEPGTMLTVDLATHWTTLVLSVAAWRLGAVLLLPGAVDGGSRAAAVREDAVEGYADRRLLVVGSGFGGRLTGDPGEVGEGLAYGEEVLAFPDDLIDEADGSAEDLAVVDHAGAARADVTHADLARAGARIAEQAELVAGDRLLTTIPPGSVEGLAVLAAALVSDLGIVLVGNPDAGRLSGTASAERVRAVVVHHETTPVAGVSGDVRVLVVGPGVGEELVTFDA